MERRLAAILATDVVGYSRLIRADEEGTIASLKTLRSDLIDPKIAEHNGRIVKLMGDGMLAEFPSVVDAVRAAVETQTAVAEHNADLPEDKRIEFRVGINLGDVVIDGDDIHGDGVNIAARLEGMAEPGGICISGMVYEGVRDRIDTPFEDLGEQKVKNIDRPIRVWQWTTDTDLAMSVSANMDEPLPLPDKPSIAVLPFENMSGDLEQEYFADGIAEDIITALSRVGWFFVIARNSSFAFKGSAVDVKRVAADLGVRYVLEGSVRKSGHRLRVTAQLIDAATGNHIWAERYDGQMDDVFDLQDRITESVVGAIEPKLRSSEIARVMRKRPKNLDAYDYVLRASPHLVGYTRADFEEARVLLEKALALDSRYPTALAYAALCRSFAIFLGQSSDPETDAAEGLRLARAAVASDAEDPTVLRVAAWAEVFLAREHETALALIDRSLALDSNSAMAYGFRAWIKIWGERVEESLEDLERALRLSPFDSWSAFYSAGMACVMTEANRLEEALSWSRQLVIEAPDWAPSYRRLAATYSRLGQLDEANAAARRFFELDPDFTLRRFDRYSPYKGGPAYERFRDDLKRAGFLE